jgi:hypothetical protein
VTKDDIEVGDDDMTKDWNHGLMMIRRSWRTTELKKGKEVKMILKHMTIRDYERFKFFHT